MVWQIVIEAETPGNLPDRVSVAHQCKLYRPGPDGGAGSHLAGEILERIARPKQADGEVVASNRHAGIPAFALHLERSERWRGGIAR